jgi:hypothetical protein
MAFQKCGSFTSWMSKEKMPCHEPCSQTGQTPTYDTPATAGKQATMLATTRIPAATGMPAVSKGNQQEKAKP